jgi:ankyrin repeat protein
LLFGGKIECFLQSFLPKILLNANADASIEDNEGKTALILSNYYETVKVLLDLRDESTDGADIDINHIDNNGMTLLMYSCRTRCCYDDTKL